MPEEPSARKIPPGEQCEHSQPGRAEAGWVSRFPAKPGTLVIWGLATLLGAWMLWQDFSPARETDKQAQTGATSDQMAAWLKAGDFPRLREAAFSNAPQSIYEVVDFLVEDGSAEALKVLRQVCDDPDGALAVTELSEKLPLPQALSLCRELTLHRVAKVRHGAICTLFCLAARHGDFSGPWPEGIERPSQDSKSLASARARWKEEQAGGVEETFEEWIYKEAVTAFICNEVPGTQLGPQNEQTLLKQLDGELMGRFGFKLLSPGG